MRKSLLKCALAGVALTVPCTTGYGLTIMLNDTGGVGAGSQAEAGFERAADMWEAILSDPVTVRLDVGFQALAAGVLGQASSNSKPVSYTAIRNALIGDQSSADDATATANLQAGSSLTFLTNDQFGTFSFDSDGSINNRFLDVNTSNLKALGITTDANANPVDDGVTADAEITFSNSFSYDFDPSDGIGAGLRDFVGIAFHEIGHALGFGSGVDTVDLVSGPNGPFSPAQGGGNHDLDNFAVFSVLDLYRFSADSLDDTAGGGAGIQDLGYGGTPYFSIDGGASNLALLSTGSFNGDGQQASHWKDGLGLGIFDPTSVPAGQANVITALDIQAMDVIGWDLSTAAVPVPAAAWMGFALLGGMGFVSKVRKSRREA